MQVFTCVHSRGLCLQYRSGLISWDVEETIHCALLDEPLFAAGGGARHSMSPISTLAWHLDLDSGSAAQGSRLTTPQCRSIENSGSQVYSGAKAMANTSRKQAPRSIGPYEIKAIISWTAIKLRLPAFMRINPIFHVSQVRLGNSSPLFTVLPYLTPCQVSHLRYLFLCLELVKTLSLFPVLESALGSLSMYWPPGTCDTLPTRCLLKLWLPCWEGVCSTLIEVFWGFFSCMSWFHIIKLNLH